MYHDKQTEFDQLLQSGANLNFIDPYGMSLIHHAATVSNGFYIEKLLENGSSPHIRDTQGWTPLHHASRAGNTLAIQLLYEADPLLVNTKGNDQETPLMVAVLHQQQDSVSKLIQEGADLNAPAINDMNPLIYAIQSHQKAIALELLSSPMIHLTYTLTDGKTAMDCSIEYGEHDVLKELIRLGVNVNRRYQGYAPLHTAIACNDLKSVEILLKCSRTMGKLPTLWGESPLELAKRLEHYAVYNFITDFEFNQKIKPSWDFLLY